jgi:hypothetical protein
MFNYLANSPDTQALSEGHAADAQAERRKRFAALQLRIPGLITAAELQRKIGSTPGSKSAGKKTDITKIRPRLIPCVETSLLPTNTGVKTSLSGVRTSPLAY